MPNRQQAIIWNNDGIVYGYLIRHTALTYLPLDKMATILVDDIFKCILFYEDEIIQIQISMKFIPESPIDNKPALVQVMACRRPGDKPLSEPMMVSLPTHTCVTRPQWINDRHGFVWYRQKYTCSVQSMWLLSIYICINVCLYACIHACMHVFLYNEIEIVYMA